MNLKTVSPLAFCVKAHNYSCITTFSLSYCYKLLLCLSLTRVVRSIDLISLFNASPASVSLWMRDFIFAHVQCFNYGDNLAHALEGRSRLWVRGEMRRFIMNARCIALCMFVSHELLFHSLSLCDHYKQADNEQTERPDVMSVFTVKKSIFLELV